MFVRTEKPYRVNIYMLSVNRRRVKDESNKNKTTDKIKPGRHLVNVNPPQRVSTFMGKVKK